MREPRLQPLGHQRLLKSLGAAESNRNQADFGVLLQSEKLPEFLGTTGAQVEVAVSKRQYVNITEIIITASCSVHGRE